MMDIPGTDKANNRVGCGDSQGWMDEGVGIMNRKEDTFGAETGHSKFRNNPLLPCLPISYQASSHLSGSYNEVARQGGNRIVCLRQQNEPENSRAQENKSYQKRQKAFGFQSGVAREKGSKFITMINLRHLASLHKPFTQKLIHTQMIILSF